MVSAAKGTAKGLDLSAKLNLRRVRRGPMHLRQLSDVEHFVMRKLAEIDARVDNLETVAGYLMAHANDQTDWRDSRASATTH